MSDNSQPDDRLIELLAQRLEDANEPGASSRLKAKLLTAILRSQEASGPLRSLDETRSRGYELCVFENIWERVTTGETAHCFNCCTLCHARVLAEHIENAPIYWGNCPYVALGKK